MEQRQRIYDAQQVGNGHGEPADIGALRGAQEETDALLRAADDVINRVLSRDNDLFLRQTRQHGGQ